MVELKRFKGCGKGTPGALYIDGQFVCFTIENTERIFPPGVYTLSLTRTQRTMPSKYEGMAYEVVPVEGRTHIKVHVANFWHELEGCVAPNHGLRPDANEVDIRGLSSTVATKKFMDMMGGRDNVPFKVTEV